MGEKKVKKHWPLLDPEIEDDRGRETRHRRRKAKEDISGRETVSVSLGGRRWCSVLFPARVPRDGDREKIFAEMDTRKIHSDHGENVCMMECNCRIMAIVKTEFYQELLWNA